MRFVCDSCRAQYMISDDKVGAKGVKVRCKKCGYVILVRKAEGNEETTQVASVPAPPGAISPELDADGPATPPPEAMTRPLGGPGEERNGAAPGGESGGAPEQGNGAHAVEPPGRGTEESAGAPVTSFGGNGQRQVLGGVEDDEIGAVFDQVLKTGPQKVQPGGQMLSAVDVGLSPEERDDLSSTRVVPADALRKLARESVQLTRGEGQADQDGGRAGGESDPGVPENDWFVAVDDQQEGPITLEKLKDMWERGELSPDSLCWRAGYSDWTPLSDVQDLRQVLAPKPQKPVIAEAPAMMGPASGAAVLTVPVESSYSVGGLAQSVRAEVPVMASAPAAETGSWQPSAASALASLVKEEMSVLSRPAAAPRSLLEISQSEAPAEHRGGLLDLPSAPPPDLASVAGNGRAAGGFLDVPAPAAPAPPSHAIPSPLAAAPGFTASQYHAYVPAPAPQGGMSRGLIISLGVVAFLLLATIGTVLFVFLRTPASAPPTEPPERVALEMPPPPVGLSPSPPVASASPPAAPATAPAPTAPAAEVAPPAPSPTPVPAPAPPLPTSAPRRARGSDSLPKTSSPGGDGETTQRSRGSTGSAGSSGSSGSSSTGSQDSDDDEFNSLFGKPGKSSSGSTPESGESKRTRGPYIPPEIGGGGVREKLSTSDVMQVVLASKPKIVECVKQQKEKQPGLSGKLVMKWTILPSGKTASVSVQSSELRSTYMASCISSLIKGMSFPRHRVQGEPIVFPFTF